MRVDAIINAKAGYADAPFIEKKLKEALFRCELHFHSPKTLDQTREVISGALKNKCEYLIVCGGDGTLNTTLKPLMSLKEKQKKELPALCVIPVGTANDLAREMKISMKIDRAARSILEGGTKIIDVLEITGDGKTAYMITNGGIGVPAQTAFQANVIRRWIKSKANSASTPPLLKPVFQVGKKLIELAGSRIYDFVLLNEVTHWDHSNWKVQIDVPGKTRFVTQAPFILVNNQPSLGGSFRPAPFTNNTDGTFNVLLVQPQQLVQQTKVILDIRRGKIPDVGDCLGFETERIRFKSLDQTRSFIFFGDGEILHKGVKEIEVRCLHPGLELTTMEVS